MCFIRNSSSTRTRFFCLFSLLLCLLSLLKPLRELQEAGKILHTLDERGSGTYHTRLQLWWLSIKNIRRLDTILYDTYRTVKETHEMAVVTRQMLQIADRRYAPGRLPLVVREHLTVLLTHSYEELVDGHGRVDGDFAAKQRLDIMLLNTASTSTVRNKP